MTFVRKISLALALMMPITLCALSIDEGTKRVMKAAQKSVKEITAKELYDKIQKDEDLYLIDIRETLQLLHGEIFHLNLIKITRGYLEFKVEEEIKDKKAQIIVYCCSGQRGMLATKTLMDMGYTNVKSLKGGIREWVEQGYPLDTIYGEMILK